MNLQGSRNIRVACIDDNELLASALKRCFESESGLEWAGWVSDGAGAVEQIRALAPDIVLMDIDLPGADSFALVRQLASEQPSVRAVMFSGHVQQSYLELAIDAGAWGYLSKNEETTSIIECIKRVGRGEAALSREVQAMQRGRRG